MQRLLCGHSREDEKKIAEYIREQLQSDIMDDQIGLKEFINSFTGEKNK